jgi:hypothetical protein
MLGAIGLLIVATASGAFMVTRVYLLIFRGELNVKGWVYSRTSTPIKYWIMTILAIVGMTLTLGVALLTAWGLTSEVG